MHYLITGGTGFIGSALVAHLLDGGHKVTVLSRSARQADGPVRLVTRLDDLATDESFDTLVNLAGASLANARWSAAYKQEIMASRLETTGHVINLLRRLEHKPGLLLSGSAVGYYGHHGDEPLTESGAVKPGFSHTLCQRWEAAAMEAEEIGVRVCLLRFGVVLDRGGGALAQMALPFQFGIANWLGDGRQWLSWIHRDDVIAAIDFLQQRPELAGAFNLTAPDPVTSKGFCTAMKRVKRTFLTLPMPAPVVRLMVGEMADELLLRGQRVLPARLQAAGFSFSQPDLDSALSTIYTK